MNYELILLAAGQGKRMLTTRNKILLDLSEKPIIVYSLDVFLQDPLCSHVILVVQKDEQSEIKEILTKYFSTQGNRITVVVGGPERQDSVYQGLLAMRNDENFVLVHDGARPFVTKNVLMTITQELTEHPAIIVGVPVKDTIKKVLNQQVIETVPRVDLWQIQTPQGFIGVELKQAHRRAQKAAFLGTDDASLMEAFGHREIKIVLGEDENIKVTTPADLIFGEAILYHRLVKESE